MYNLNLRFRLNQLLYIIERLLSLRFAILIICLLYSPTEIFGQSDSSDFYKIYNELLASPSEIDEATAAVLIKNLKKINRKYSGSFDSLVARITIWDCTRKIPFTEVSQRIFLLRSCHDSLLVLSTQKHEEMAELHMLYINEFRYNYQVDSIDLHLNMLRNIYHIQAIPLECNYNGYTRKVDSPMTMAITMHR